MSLVGNRLKHIMKLLIETGDILLSCPVQLTLSCDEAGLGDPAHRGSFDWQQEVGAVVSALRAT